MLSDDQVTELQFALDAGDVATLQRLLQGLSATELSELQLYSNSTVMMYALQRSTPEVVDRLLAHGVQPFELPYSDNNELKSALRHPSQAPRMLELALSWLPLDLAQRMIVEDWDLEDPPSGEAQSALALAQALGQSHCLELLRQKLEGFDTKEARAGSLE